MKVNKLHIIKCFFIVAVAVSVCGCRKNKHVDPSIGFSSVTTKALVEDVDDIKNGGGLSIFGLRVPESGTGILQFDNRALTYDSGSATGWSYDGNLEYWAPEHTYYYLALFPYNSSNYTYDITKKGASFSYESSLASEQTDIMYAFHKRAYVTGGDSSPVPLNLTHTCASLSFLVRNVSTSYISVSDIYLDGLYNNGVCSIDSTALKWVTTGSIVSDNTTYPGATSGLSLLPISTDLTYPMFADTILVVPQQVRNRPDIMLHATITPSSGSPYDISPMLQSTEAVPTWVAGKHYIYTLSVTDTRIVFEVQVLNWIDDEVHLE